MDVREAFAALAHRARFADEKQVQDVIRCFYEFADLVEAVATALDITTETTTEAAPDDH